MMFKLTGRNSLKKKKTNSEIKSKIGSYGWALIQMTGVLIGRGD